MTINALSVLIRTLTVRMLMLCVHCWTKQAMKNWTASIFLVVLLKIKVAQK